MRSSALTSKGQITIPSEMRRQLKLQAGDKIGFLLEDGHIILFKKLDDIEAAFGICQSKKTVSLEDMEDAIRTRGGKK